MPKMSLIMPVRFLLAALFPTFFTLVTTLLNTRSFLHGNCVHYTVISSYFLYSTFLLLILSIHDMFSTCRQVHISFQTPLRLYITFLFLHGLRMTSFHRR